MGNLVISRKKNQKVRLRLPDTVVRNRDIWLTVAEIRGDKVRLAINADKGILIARDELLEEKERVA